MKKILIFSLVYLLMACQHTSNTDVNREVAGTKSGNKFGKKAIKDYFLNVTAEERKDALERASIFSMDFNPSTIPQVDIIADLGLQCGADYKITKAKITKEDRMSSFGDFKNQKSYDSYIWSKVSCEYHPDTEKSMGGGSTKFLCDFPDAESKDGKKTKKVRYASSSYAPLDSEVVETTLASNLAKLIGLPTKTFCPAVIECKGCPSSNPWRDDRASKAPSRKTHDLEWGLVESTLEAYIISMKVSGNAPMGLDWTELKILKADSEELRKKKLIEREAWMLWVSFIQNTDAGDFNLRVTCTEAIKTADEKYYCEKPVVYMHDYGHSFHRHFTYSKWAKIPVFDRSEINSGCRLGLNNDNLPRRAAIKGIVLGAEISAEARDLLLSRLNWVTDDQWVTLFQMSRAEEATGESTATWLKDIKKKLQQMKSAQCLPFDAGRSVLFK